MSEIKNSGLDQYGAQAFEQQQFGTAGVEGVNERRGSPTNVYKLFYVYARRTYVPFLVPVTLTLM